MIGEVETLVNDSTLNSGQGNALIGKLEAAIKQLDKGKPGPAINQIESFINQVEALVKASVLPAADGQDLIDAANLLLGMLL